MSDQPEPQSLAVRMQSVREWLEVQTPELEKALKPIGMDAGRFARAVLTCVIRNPRLSECSRASFILAVMESAHLGLEPDSVAGFSYIIPYKRTATLIVGYKGYVQLAWRSNASLTAQVVHEKDAFHFEAGLKPKLTHTPAPPPAGEVIAAYAVIRTKAHALPMWLWRDEIEAHRARSRAWQDAEARGSKDSPWHTDFEAMCRKTAVRVIAPYAPVSPQFLRAYQVDERPFEPEEAVTPVVTPGVAFEEPEMNGE